jgi:hypothetical protein
MGRDRNIAMGLGSNTNAAATINSWQDLVAHYGLIIVLNCCYSEKSK